MVDDHRCRYVRDVSVNPEHLAWTAAGLAWALAVPLYFVTKFILVIPHEGGHATMGTLLFQRVRKIEFGSDGGGGTSFHQDQPWFFALLIGVAGYLGPSGFGLLAAWLLREGLTGLVLWGSIVSLAVMLLFVRTWVGWVSVPGLLILLYVVAVSVPEPVRTLCVHVWVWFLLIAAVERIVVLVIERHYLGDLNDAKRLADATHTSPHLWAVLFLVGTVAALVHGASMLIPTPA